MRKAPCLRRSRAAIPFQYSISIPQVRVNGNPVLGMDRIAVDKPGIERIYGDSFPDITDLNQLPIKLTTLVKRHIRV